MDENLQCREVKSFPMVTQLRGRSEPTLDPFADTACVLMTSRLQVQHLLSES